MKKLLTVFLLAFLSWSPASITSATPLDDTSTYLVDWNRYGYYSKSNDRNNFSFGDLVIPEGAVIDSVELVLTHKGNSNKKGVENWALGFNGTAYNLNKSKKGWSEQSFSLDPNLFSEGLALDFTLRERTKGKDKILLDKAVLNIHYIFPALDSEGEEYISLAEALGGEAEGGNTTNQAPVPEPATMLLLGTGLIGLAGFGRRKFLKK